MSVSLFDLCLTVEQARALVRHAEAAYPVEACGVLVGTPAAGTPLDVVPMNNALAKGSNPWRGRAAFAFADAELLRLLTSLDETGHIVRVLYHSHCDAPPVLSAMDRAALLPAGGELFAGVTSLVLSVVEGGFTEAMAYRFEPNLGGFREQVVSGIPSEPRFLAVST